MNKEGPNFDDDTWTHDGDRETFLVSNNPLGGKTGTNPSTLVEKRNNPNAKKKNGSKRTKYNYNNSDSRVIGK